MSSTILPGVAAERVLPSGLNLVEEKDGYVEVSGPDGRGMCDSAGKLLIPAKFDGIRYVGEHLFAVEKYREDGSIAWWLLNEKGEMISKLPDWTRIDYKRFQEGLLNIGDSYSPTAFIDTHGRVALNFDKFTDVKEFSHGLAEAYYNDRDGRWGGYINHQGRMVIGPYKDVDLSKFENGRARIGLYTAGSKPKFGIVTTQGKFVLPPKFERLNQLDDGKYVVSEKGKFMFLDREGKVILRLPDGCTDVSSPDKLDKTSWIACGFGGTVPRKDYMGNLGSKWGYCDINGKVVMTPRFSYCQSFKGNRAVAYTNNDGEEQACGVIDKQGKWIVEPKYKYVSLSDSATWSLGPATVSDGKLTSPGVNRAAVFQDLLRKHDFIGMDLKDLEKVLGAIERSPWEQQSKIGVKTAHFVISPGGCTGATLLQFTFDTEDRLVGWRLFEGGGLAHNPSWITENVITDDDSKGLVLGNLVPKK